MEIIGKALAGHYLDSDKDKLGREATPVNSKKYSNVLTDYICLVIAEVKAKQKIAQPIDPDFYKSREDLINLNGEN